MKNYQRSKLIWRGIVRSASAVVVGATHFAFVLSLYFLLGLGIGGMLSALIIGTILATLLTIVPGILGGVILAILINRDYVRQTLDNKSAKNMGGIVGMISVIPACLIVAYFVGNLMSPDAFVICSLIAMLFGCFRGSHAAQVLILDVQALPQ